MHNRPAGHERKAKRYRCICKQENTSIIICSIKAASAGVDGLQKACNDVLFIEEPWTAADRDQAESRVHRNGLKDGATMYHMLGKNTIDQKMWKIILKRKRLYQRL